MQPLALALAAIVTLNVAVVLLALRRAQQREAQRLRRRLRELDRPAEVPPR